MKRTNDPCPVCLRNDRVDIEAPVDQPLFVHIGCGYCGRFSVEQLLMFVIRKSESLTLVQRAALSCRIYRHSGGSEGQLFQITNEVLEDLRTSDGLYDPVAESTNLIRDIGDMVSNTGEPIEQFLGRDIQRSTCAPSMALADQVFKELLAAGTIQGMDTSGSAERGYGSVTLTLEGWKKYNAEKHGRAAHNYGFLAMEFFDKPDKYELPRFVNEVVKPAVKEETKYDLHDVRAFGSADIVENIIVNAIKDARFVIADLTHDNSGVYWEAGYAEALRKPVIYICESTKFDEKGTHFDTSHRYTVKWSSGDPGKFRIEFKNALRRSLNENF